MTAYKTPYDHVYIKIDMPELGSGKTMVFQASKTIINFMSWDVFSASNIPYAEFPLEIDDGKRKAFIDFMLSTVGKPYSLAEVAGIAWIKICSWFGKKVQNPFKEGTSQYVCSVLGAYVMQNFTQDQIPEDFEDVDPETLYNYLKSKQPSP